MISASSAALAALTARTNYKLHAAIGLASGSSLSLGDDDFRLTGYITDGAGASALPLGAAVSRGIRIEITNPNGQYQNTAFYGAVIHLTMEIALTASTSETVNLGWFTVNSPAEYGETIALTAQDDMFLADKAFSAILTYPVTLSALLSAVCTACGLTLASGTSVPAFSVDSTPDSSLTCREIIGDVAMLCGGNARISPDRELEIATYDFSALASARAGSGVPSGMADLGRWFSLSTDTEDVTITGIQTTTQGEDGEETVLTGSSGYVLEVSNPLIAGKEAAALALIGSVMIGGQLRKFSGSHVGFPLLQFMDHCRVTDWRGNHYWSVVTDISQALWGRLTVSNSAASVLQAGRKYTTPETKAIIAAREMVNTERTARQAAIQTLAAAMAASTGLYETAETAPGGGTIYYLHDKSTLAASTVVIKITSEALAISTDGGTTWTAGYEFATATAVLNRLIASGIDASQISVTNLDASNINTGQLLAAYLGLYGAMTVYTDSTLATSAGAVGYTSGIYALDYALGMLLSSANRYGIVVVSDAGVFLGHYDPDTDMWVDGSGGTISQASYGAKVLIASDEVNIYGHAIMNDGATLNGRLIGGELRPATALGINYGGTGATDAAAARSNLGMETVTTEALAGGYINAYRNLQTVTVAISYPAAGAFTPTVNAWNTLATLSADFRPPVNIDFAGVNNQASSNTARAFRITTAGVIQYWADASGETATVRPAGTITYIVS